MTNIIQNIFDLVGYFGDVAVNGPLSAALLLVGALLIGFSSLVMAYLAAGAAVDFITPDSLGQQPPQRG